MLFFGLGTLPTLLAASAGSQYLIAGFRHPVVRQCFSVIVAIYALFLIYAAIS
jgi:sulfite exporter TauE/SafE